MSFIILDQNHRCQFLIQTNAYMLLENRCKNAHFEIKRSTFSVLLNVLSDRRTTGTIPNITAPSHHTLYSLCWSEGRPDIKIEYWFSSKFFASGIVVDDISYLVLLTVVFSLDKPVMSIEWWLGTAIALDQSYHSYKIEG